MKLMKLNKTEKTIFLNLFLFYSCHCLTHSFLILSFFLIVSLFLIVLKGSGFDLFYTLLHILWFVEIILSNFFADIFFFVYFVFHFSCEFLLAYKYFTIMK